MRVAVIVIYNPHNDQTAEAIPLFRRMQIPLEKMAGYSIALSDDEPLAYAICTENECQVIAAQYYKLKIKSGTIVEVSK